MIQREQKKHKEAEGRKKRRKVKPKVMQSNIQQEYQQFQNVL